MSEHDLIADRMSLAEEAGKLIVEVADGDPWGAHPEHTVEDWQEAVLEDDTRLGYWEWVQSLIESEQEADASL